MKRLAVTILPALLFLVTHATSANAQKEKPENKAPNAILKIPVLVEEEPDKFWADGKRQTFNVFIEDKEAPIKSFQGPRNPTIVLVVFDTVSDLARVDIARSELSEAIK